MDILTISQYHRLVNTVLADVGEFSVSGEVTSLRVSRNGGVFIDLKDPEAEAVLKISNFARNLDGWKLIDVGMQVVVQGYSEIYAPYGSISFKARKISPAGEGSLKAAFEKLRALLEVEGLFALERKRQLPTYLTRIALITGHGSAAYADFTKILAESGASIEVDFYPVLVQGDKAEYEVEQAIRLAALTDVEVICVVRGGGSLEDLKAFNSERVARAIFASVKPVIVGVGHEVDTSIADLVADVRASTPSQAAYYIAGQNDTFLSEIANRLSSAEVMIANELTATESLMTKLLGLSQKLLIQINELTGRVSNQGKLQQRLGQLRLKLSEAGNKLTALAYSQSKLMNALSSNHALTEQRQATLKAYDPANTLARGFALVSYNGQYISAAKDIPAGAELNIDLKADKLLTKLISVTPKHGD
jgi:exodeoxyribonuclease VII large subunit